MNPLIEEDVREPLPPHWQPRQKRVARMLKRSEIDPADAPYAACYAQLLAHPGADKYGSLAVFAASMRELEKHGHAEHKRLLAHCREHGLPIDATLKNGPAGSGRAPSKTAKLRLTLERYGLHPRNLRWLEEGQSISDTERANTNDFYSRQQKGAKNGAPKT